jgi:hypothetical protein
MAVVRKGESTPWSTDHANWIFANRFFFHQESGSAWRQPKSKGWRDWPFSNGKKNNELNWEATLGLWWASVEWIRTIDGAPLKRCQAKIVCLVLGSSDPNYRTKQMASGDARDPWVAGQQIGTQSLKVFLPFIWIPRVCRKGYFCFM